MSRSIKKGVYVDPKLAAKVSKAKSSGSKAPIKTWSRACTIIPDFIGIVFAVHNGKAHIEFNITEEMVGHKLGEFSPTTTFRSHGGKMAKGK